MSEAIEKEDTLLRDTDEVLIRGRYLRLGEDIVYHDRLNDWVVYLDESGKVFSEWNEDIVRWEIRTSCGLLVDGWTRESDDHRSFVSLDAGIADKFARPCRRCFKVT